MVVQMACILHRRWLIVKRAACLKGLWKERLEFARTAELPPHLEIIAWLNQLLLLLLLLSGYVIWLWEKVGEDHLVMR